MMRFISSYLLQFSSHSCHMHLNWSHVPEALSYIHHVSFHSHESTILSKRVASGKAPSDQGVIVV